MSTVTSDHSPAGTASRPRQVRAIRSILIWTTGVLAAAMLATALFIFVATLSANGASGTALIVDFYQRLAATCL